MAVTISCLLLLCSVLPVHGVRFRPLARGAMPASATRARVIACAASFPELGVRDEIVEALAAARVSAPNEMQKRAIPAIAGGANLVLGAQTGSGKTFAYLVPVMQQLKSREEAAGARALPKRPRALVLLPTRELALQVRDVAKSIGQRARLSVGVVHGGVPESAQRRQLDLPIDVLVATPGRLVSHLRSGNVYLGDVRHVVLDEVDTMFDAGFGAELEAILKITTRELGDDARAAEGDTVQHVAVGATHPEATLMMYEQWMPGAKRLLSSGIHTIPPSLRQSFVPCNGPDAKVAALRDLLGVPDGDGKPSLGRLVIFTNSQASARFVDHTLVEDGYATANYHGAVPANERAANFDSFVRGDAHILVTTDLAARGLDTLDVKHVVQFDFAKSAADYVHRCGRTARAGKSGIVTSLVTKSDKHLVNALRGAQQAGDDLVAAGQKHLREARQLVTPTARGGGGGGGGGKGERRSATAFPDCSGVRPRAEFPGGGGDDDGGGGPRGARAAGGGGGGRGRGGSSRGRGSGRTGSARRGRRS